MRPSFRPRPTFAKVAAVLALVLALATSGLAQPVADTSATLGKKVRNALRIGRKADRRARKALREIKKGVPRAAEATHAAQATTLDGLRTTGSQSANVLTIQRLNLNAGDQKTALTTDEYSLTLTCAKTSQGRVRAGLRLDPTPGSTLTVNTKAVTNATQESDRVVMGPTEASTNPRDAGGSFFIYESFGLRVTTGAFFVSANPLGTNVDCTGGGYVLPTG